MLAFLSSGSRHQTSHLLNLTPTVARNLPSLKTIGTSSTRLFSSGPPTQYVLFYNYIPDVLEKRPPHRDLHLSLASDLAKDGKCLSGGPTTPLKADVPDGAVFVFSDEESANFFVKEDPYVKHGIVTDWSIKEWTVAVQS